MNSQMSDRNVILIIISTILFIFIIIFSTAKNNQIQNDMQWRDEPKTEDNQIMQNKYSNISIDRLSNEIKI